VDYTDLQEIDPEKFDRYVAEYKEVFGEAPWETEDREFQQEPDWKELYQKNIEKRKKGNKEKAKYYSNEVKEYMAYIEPLAKDYGFKEVWFEQMMGMRTNREFPGMLFVNPHYVTYQKGLWERAPEIFDSVTRYEIAYQKSYDKFDNWMIKKGHFKPSGLAYRADRETLAGINLLKTLNDFYEDNEARLNVVANTLAARWFVEGFDRATFEKPKMQKLYAWMNPWVKDTILYRAGKLYHNLRGEGS